MAQDAGGLPRSPLRWIRWCGAEAKAASLSLAEKRGRILGGEVLCRLGDLDEIAESRGTGQVFSRRIELDIVP
jgi:hypothetical protein